MSRSTDVPGPHFSTGSSSRIRTCTCGSRLAGAAAAFRVPFVAFFTARFTAARFTAGFTTRLTARFAPAFFFGDFAAAFFGGLEAGFLAVFDAGFAALAGLPAPASRDLVEAFGGAAFRLERFEPVVRRTSVSSPDFLTLPTPAPNFCNGCRRGSGNFRYFKLPSGATYVNGNPARRA